MEACELRCQVNRLTLSGILGRVYIIMCTEANMGLAATDVFSCTMGTPGGTDCTGRCGADDTQHRQAEMYRDLKCEAFE